MCSFITFVIFLAVKVGYQCRAHRQYLYFIRYIVPTCRQANRVRVFFFFLVVCKSNTRYYIIISLLNHIHCCSYVDNNNNNSRKYTYRLPGTAPTDDVTMVVWSGDNYSYIISHRGRQTSFLFIFHSSAAAVADVRSFVVFNRIEKTSLLPRCLHIACTRYLYIEIAGIGTNAQHCSRNNNNNHHHIYGFCSRSYSFGFFPCPNPLLRVLSSHDYNIILCCTCNNCSDLAAAVRICNSDDVVVVVVVVESVQCIPFQLGRLS